MAKPPNNRFPDHPPTPKQYLSHVSTRVDGSYRAHSIDPSNRMRTIGFLTAAGVFLAHVIDAAGHESSATPGGTKRFSQSDTKTTTNHADASAGGGKSDKTAGGGDTQHGGDKTDSVKGAKLAASKQSAKNFASGGNGRHVMKGDQSNVVEEGGMHFDISKGYTLTTKDGSVALKSTGGDINVSAPAGNYAITTAGNQTHIASDDMIFSSTTRIILQVGGSKIEITPSKITIKSAAIEFVKG